MKRSIDIEKSSGTFKIRFLDEKNESILSVNNFTSDSPLLLAVIDSEINDVVNLEKNGLSFIVLEKDMNIVYNKVSLLDTKVPIKYNNEDIGVENHVIKTGKIFENKLNFLFYYYPDNKDQITKDLLDFKLFLKDNNFYIFDRFYNIFNKHVIKRIVYRNEKITLCCAPSHNSLGFVNNAMTHIIKRVCDNYRTEFVDGSNVLCRKYLIAKATDDNSVRDIDIQYKSLAIRDIHLVRNRTILLLDDIYTSGATINACKKKLLENGASKVIVVTFGRTKR